MLLNKRITRNKSNDYDYFESLQYRQMVPVKIVVHKKAEIERSHDINWLNRLGTHSHRNVMMLHLVRLCLEPTQITSVLSAFSCSR